MGKRAVRVALCMALVMTLIPFGAGAAEVPAIPSSISAPEHIGVSESFDGSDIWGFWVGYTNPANVRSFAVNMQAWYEAGKMGDLSIALEWDYKYNPTGSWHHNPAEWDTAEPAPGWHTFTGVDVELENYNIEVQSGWMEPLITQTSQLVDNTLYLRIRYKVSYYDEATETTKLLLSPWTEGAIGKLAQQLAIVVEPPVLTKAEIDPDSTGAPRIKVTCAVPASIWQLDNSGGDVDVQVDLRIDNGQWTSQTGMNYLADVFWVSPANLGVSGTIDVKAAKYEIRARHRYIDSAQEKWSDYSNIVQINVPAFYKAASDWAVGELQEANDYGLVPDILIGADLTRPITREEFCELALVLYEKTTGLVPEPFSPNPFTDTTNTQILKAFKLGITKGTSATTFSPNWLITRQECATMLFRAIKAIAPAADYSITGVPDFPDQKYIADWAADGAKYMFKLGIVKGDTNGNFMPRAITTAHEATGYGMATREAAVLMSVRTYNKLK